MNKICKKCGLPIKVNDEMYEVFEGMHWLCFHLEFEHGDYDPDEPCDDPSCPWNRVSGNDLLIMHSHSDIRIINLSGSAEIFLNIKEVETDRYPSIKFEVTLFDELIKRHVKTIWAEEDSLLTFVNQLKDISINGRGKAILKAMSENDFSMQIETTDGLGHLIVTYKFQSYKYINNYRTNYAYENGFEYEFSNIESLLKSFRKLNESLNNGIY